MKDSGTADFPALLERARADDSRAVDELLQLVRQRMMGFIVINTGKVDSSDLAQELILRVHDHLESFEGETEGQFWAWVRQIARNLQIDENRKAGAGKRGKPPLELPVDSRGDVRLPGKDSTPSAGAQRREAAVKIAEARKLLSSEEQQVIRLRTDEELPWAKIARIMKRESEKDVQKFYRETIRKLSEILTEGGDAPQH